MRAAECNFLPAFEERLLHSLQSLNTSILFRPSVRPSLARPSSYSFSFSPPTCLPSSGYGLLREKSFKRPSVKCSSRERDRCTFCALLGPILPARPPDPPVRPPSRLLSICPFRNLLRLAGRALGRLAATGRQAWIEPRLIEGDVLVGFQAICPSVSRSVHSPSPQTARPRPFVRAFHSSSIVTASFLPPSLRTAYEVY